MTVDVPSGTMSRQRLQHGHVERSGKRIKVWKGHFHTYESASSGRERRVHHAVVLGRCADMTKAEARARLQDVMRKEIASAQRRKDDWTFAQLFDGSLMGRSEGTQRIIRSIFNNHGPEREGILQTFSHIGRVRSALGELNGVDALIADALLKTGTRPGELFAVRWNDIGA